MNKNAPLRRFFIAKPYIYSIHNRISLKNQPVSLLQMEKTKDQPKAADDG